MGERVRREEVLHYINPRFGTHDNHQATSATWELLGEDLEEYSVEMNPIITVERNILDEDYVYHDGYEPTASVSPYYAREGTELFDTLHDIIAQFLFGDACITDVIEVYLWRPVSDVANTYYGRRKRVCVGIDSYGGDYTGYQIPFTLTYQTRDTTSVMFNIETNGIYTP